MKKKTFKRKRVEVTQDKKFYFTKVHEEAIIKYVLSEDRKEREELYRTLIGPTFSEMVDKIVYTYKFTHLANIDELKNECKVWLTTILDKFDAEKGSKAFSYFSVVTKNWFIHKVKKNNIRNKREIYYEDISDENDFTNISVENNYINELQRDQFWEKLKGETEKWSASDQTDNEKKVLYAVQLLMSDPDAIEIFNKKAIYLYIREYTNLNTKQVVANLNKIRKRYKDFKIKWELDEQQ